MAKGKYAIWLKRENLIRIQGWAKDGLTDEQIAHNIGINVSTLYQWEQKYSQIVEALKEGKDVSDRRVENALYKSAVGYEYDETTKEPDKDGNLVVTKVIHKIVQPNTTAQIFWLKNRKRTEWRDRQELGLSGSVDISEIIAKRRAKVNEVSDDN